MSDGRKAAYDDAQEEAWNKAMERIKQVSPGFLLTSLTQSISNLTRFMETNPALTKTQFYLIERTEELLRRCLG